MDNVHAFVSRAFRCISPLPITTSRSATPRLFPQPYLVLPCVRLTTMTLSLKDLAMPVGVLAVLWAAFNLALRRAYPTPPAGNKALVVISGTRPIDKGRRA